MLWIHFKKDTDSVFVELYKIVVRHPLVEGLVGLLIDRVVILVFILVLVKEKPVVRVDKPVNRHMREF